MTPRPGRVSQPTAKGAPLGHLREDQYRDEIEGAVESTPAPTDQERPQRATPQPGRPLRQTEQQHGNHGNHGEPPTAKPTEVAAANPSASENVDGDGNRTAIITASVMAILLVGSCCMGTGFIALWWYFAM